MCIVCALRNPTNLNALLDQHLDRGSVTPSAANPNDPVWTAFDAVRETGDLAESTATTASLIVGQSAYGTLSSSTDEDWFAIELVAGVTYDFRLLGFGSAFLDDPLIRIYNSAGVQQASNDDGFTSLSGTHERDSELVFTATTTGTYYIAADAFSTETTGGDYVISATPHDPNGRIFTADEIAWQLINNGEAFFSSPEGIGFDVGVGGTLTVNITGLTADGQFLARQALAVWSGFTGITFSETGGAADITFDDNQSGAFANPVPNVAETFIESATVNIGTDWLTQFGTGLESYSFETYIHEIGHAIGLGHGGNYNGSATYTFDNFYQNDSVAWSIMSYMNADNDEFDFGNPTDWNFYVDAAFRYMYSPMIADMIAIEYLYGINTGAFGGNTTWGVNGNTGVLALDSAVNSGALMAMMVYDRGGIDTVNMATGTVAQVISLVDGSLSSVLGGRNNLGIARDSVVENAIGGSAQDTIYGNEVGNRLEGPQRQRHALWRGGSGHADRRRRCRPAGRRRQHRHRFVPRGDGFVRADMINAALNVGRGGGRRLRLDRGAGGVELQRHAGWQQRRQPAAGPGRATT
jgi:serralysin